MTLERDRGKWKHFEGRAGTGVWPKDREQPEIVLEG